VLEGNLDDFTVPEILRLLAFTSKSGRLSLTRTGASGRVDLADGRVREASGDAERLSIARRLLGAGLVTADDLSEVLRGRDVLPTDLELARELARTGTVESGILAEVVREQTTDAIFDLLRWEDGSFRFDRGEADPGDGQVLDLAVPVDEVLAEATSRLESWPSVEERTGESDAVVTIIRPKGDRAQVSLPPDGWSLLSFVDGRRTVTELAHLSGQGEFRTRRTLVALLDEGVVTVGDTGGPGHVERLLADHERLAALEAELGATARPTAAPSPRDAQPTSAPSPAPAQVPDARMPDAPASDAPAPRATRPAAADQARPGPVTVRTEEVAAALEADTDPVPSAPKQPRGGRLRTDPSVDADLVRRLIDGVESL
jgi:hypothetical protein